MVQQLPQLPLQRWLRLLNIVFLNFKRPSGRMLTLMLVAALLSELP